MWLERIKECRRGKVHRQCESSDKLFASVLLCFFTPCLRKHLFLIIKNRKKGQVFEVTRLSWKPLNKLVPSWWLLCLSPRTIWTTRCFWDQDVFSNHFLPSQISTSICFLSSTSLRCQSVPPLRSSQMVDVTVCAAVHGDQWGSEATFVSTWSPAGEQKVAG